MNSDGEQSCGSDGEKMLHAPKRNAPAYMFKSSDGGSSGGDLAEEEADFNLKKTIKGFQKGTDDNTNTFRDNNFNQPANEVHIMNLKICICGLPCRVDQENCDFCEGKNSVQLEGEIYKK